MPSQPPVGAPTVPGPASLLANAVEKPNVSPLQPDGSAASTRSTSAESLTRPDLPRATTTITTVGEPEPSKGGAGTVTTETFTHVGTAKVDASLSKVDGSVTIKPVAAHGTAPSQIKTKRHRSRFTPRTSHFDRNNSDSAKDQFRGFYTLFWIMLAVSGAKTAVRHWQENSTIFGTSFARLILEDGWVLALSDGVMVVSTFLCVPFAQVMNRGWIRYWRIGAVLQHLLQTAFLGLSVAWTVHKDWPWVQSGYMVLHTLTMLMKVHSYCSTNGDLSEKSRKLAALEPQLERLVEKLGGTSKVESEARVAWRAAVETTDGETSDLHEDSNLAESTLRKRNIGPKDEEEHAGERKVVSHADDRLEALTWHLDTELSKLAKTMIELDEALVSTGVERVRFPANLTYYNFFDFLAVPTLVYELEYPRTKIIRPMYVLEKTGALFGTFGVLIMIVEHYILPVKPQAGDSFLKSALDLALPFMMNYLLIFYLIFECVANVFAELTCFADREFYQDWWNSTTFDEFSRKWNVPVHSFLLRHVYSSTISTYRFSKFKAAFATFLLSACVHELVMAVSMKKLRLYLFVLQMAQLPLIMIGRLPIFRKYPALGNLFFWLGLLSGFPLLAIAYIRF